MTVSRRCKGDTSANTNLLSLKSCVAFSAFQVGLHFQVISRLALLASHKSYV